MYTFVPSGATPDFLKWHMWWRQEMDGEVHVTFDRGKAILNEKLQAKRQKDAYTLVRIGPYWHPDTVLKQHSEWWMASAHHLKSKQGRFAQRAGVKMLSDSGGWQIKSGAVDFVDPYDVIKRHNACADVGMALDYPPRRDVDTSDEVFGILSRVQKGHNEIFKRERRLTPGDELGLINVAHGVNADQWRRWVETVNDPVHFLGWAISQDSNQDKRCIYRGAAVLYREFGIRDEWVHLFGVSGPNMLPVVAWLSRFFPRLTSDSSSWQGGRFGRYLHLQNGALRTLKIGRKNPEVDDAVRLDAYCQCRFCEVMGTFGSYRMKGTYPALSAHGIIAIQSAVAHWNRLATELDLDAYRDEIKRSFNGVPVEEGSGEERGSSATKILEQLDYLDDAMTEGPEYAERKHPKK